MTTGHGQPPSPQDERKDALNRRLESGSWALFIIMIGCLFLVPKDTVPGGTWLIGAGVIMLALNLVRCLNGIKISAFTIILGILALAAGLSDCFGVKLPIIPIMLILIGLNIILGPLMKKARASGPPPGPQQD